MLEHIIQLGIIIIIVIIIIIIITPQRIKSNQ